MLSFLESDSFFLIFLKLWQKQSFLILMKLQTSDRDKMHMEAKVRNQEMGLVGETVANYKYLWKNRA